MKNISNVKEKGVREKMEKCRTKNCESDWNFISVEIASGKTTKSCGFHVENWFVNTHIVIKWDEVSWKVVSRNKFGELD